MKRYLLIKPNDPETEFGYFDFSKHNENQYRIKFITGKFKSNTINEDIEIILDDRSSAEQEFLKFKNKLYFLKFNDISEYTVNHWDTIEFIKNDDIGLIISQDDYNYFTIRYLPSKNLSTPIYITYENNSISKNTLNLFNTLLEREEKIINIVDSKLFSLIKEELPEVVEQYTDYDLEENTKLSKNINKIIDRLTFLEFIKIYPDDLINYCGELGFGFDSKIDEEHGVGILLKNWGFYSYCQKNDFW